LSEVLPNAPIRVRVRELGVRITELRELRELRVMELKVRV